MGEGSYIGFRGWGLGRTFSFLGGVSSRSITLHTRDGFIKAGSRKNKRKSVEQLRGSQAKSFFIFLPVEGFTFPKKSKKNGVPPPLLHSYF